MAQVFYCNVEPLRDASLYAHYAALVPPEQQQRLLTMRFEEDRLRSLAAGLMLHCALDALQVPRHLRRVQRLPGGKPILPDYPLQISLSHSGTVALCAVSTAPIGADVQHLRAPADGLLRRVCSEEERTYLVSQPDSAAAFTALWTRKESLLKMLEKTLSEDLQCLSCLDSGRSDWSFSERTLFGLPACVCSGDEVVWREIDITSVEIQNSFDSWT